MRTIKIAVEGSKIRQALAIMPRRADVRYRIVHNPSAATLSGCVALFFSGSMVPNIQQKTIYALTQGIQVFRWTAKGYQPYQQGIVEETLSQADFEPNLWQSQAEERWAEIGRRIDSAYDASLANYLRIKRDRETLARIAEACPGRHGAKGKTVRRCYGDLMCKLLSLSNAEYRSEVSRMTVGEISWEDWTSDDVFDSVDTVALSDATNPHWIDSDPDGFLSGKFLDTEHRDEEKLPMDCDKTPIQARIQIGHRILMVWNIGDSRRRFPIRERQDF